MLLKGVTRKPWEFLHENILLKDQLGEGEFGEVRAGETNIDGEIRTVAVKIVCSLYSKAFINIQILKYYNSMPVTSRPYAFFH